MDFQFSPTESMFYALVFIAAGSATLFRVWRDNEPVRGRTLIGRCLSAGSVTFGVVAVCIGSRPAADSLSGFYWVAIATLTSYYWKEIEEKALKRIIDKVVSLVLGLFGIKDDAGK